MRDPFSVSPRKSLLFITPPVAIATTIATLVFVIGFVVWDALARYQGALVEQKQRAEWGVGLAASQAERQLDGLAGALDGLMAPGRPLAPAAIAEPGPALGAVLEAALAAQPMLSAAAAWTADGALLGVSPAGKRAEIAPLFAAAAPVAGDDGFRVLGTAEGGAGARLAVARWTAPRSATGARLLAFEVDAARIGELFVFRPIRADGLIALLLPDGAMLGAVGGTGPIAAAPEALRRAMAQRDAGLLAHVAWPDGVVRNTAFRRLGHHDLVAIVGASEAAADEAFARALGDRPAARILVILLVAAVGVALVRHTLQQRTLQQRIGLWEQAAEASPDAVLILDARRAGLPIIYANPAYEAMTGLHRAAAIGHPCPLLAEADAATAQRLAEALAGNGVFHGKIASRRATDGARIMLRVSLHPLHDVEGARTNLICRVQDITERQQAAETERAAQTARDWALDELRKALDRVATSEGRFRDFAASASDWFWETDGAGRIAWLSENAQVLSGWRMGDLPPLPQLRAMDAADGPPPADFRGVRASGQGPEGPRILEVAGRPVLAADGTCLGYRGVVMDVTEQEQAAAAARRDELRMAAAVEHLPIGMLVVDAQGRVLLCNARYCDLFGVERPQRGESWRTLGRQVIDELRRQLDPAAIDLLIAERRRLTASGHGAMILPWLGGRTYRLEERRHDGGDRTIVVVDVTELEESRARLLDAVENISSGFAIFDAAERLVLGNRTFHDQVTPLLEGGDIEGMTASAIFGGLAAAGRLRLMQIDGRPASPDEIATRVELATGDPFLMDTADGRTLQVRLRESGEGGRVAIFSDVSLLRQMDAALRASEAKFRGLAQASGDGILIVDEAGEIQFANREAHRMFGYDGEESVLDNISGLVPAESQERHGGLMAGFFAARRSRAMDAGRALRAVRRDGTTFPVEVVLSYYETPDGPLVQANVRDITLRLRAEEAERQRAKMVALGTLAGGIAHDLNNALVPILTLSELLLDAGTASPEDAEMLATIVSAAERARDLVRNILAFSRRGVRKVATLDLGGVVAKDMPMLRAVIPAAIRLDYAAPAGPVPVAADESNLHQVVINLVSNAAQAIGSRTGRIDIAVVALTQPDGAPDGPPAGRYGRLTVADDGPGMDEETRQRLFEPFFTTKPVGEGTGLGLAIVHGIVTSHGATLGVASAPGQGTCFTIWFPLRAGAEVPGDAGSW